MSRILLVLTGAPELGRAAQWAVTAAARDRPSTVVAVAVCPPEGVLAGLPQEPLFAWNPFATGPTEPPAWTREHDQRRAVHRHHTQLALDALLAGLPPHPDVEVEGRVLDEAHCHDEILHLAAAVDLVVMDADRRDVELVVDPERLARHVLQRTLTPVVLVP